MRSITRRTAVLLGWLALILCLATTVDVVVDVAFEALAPAADAASDELENAAEHLLMPSPREQPEADGSGTNLPLDHSPVTAVLSVALIPNRAIHTTSHPPPRSRPVSSAVPLRI